MVFGLSVRDYNHGGQFHKCKCKFAPPPPHRQLICRLAGRSERSQLGAHHIETRWMRPIWRESEPSELVHGAPQKCARLCCVVLARMLNKHSITTTTETKTNHIASNDKRHLTELWSSRRVHLAHETTRLDLARAESTCFQRIGQAFESTRDDLTLEAGRPPGATRALEFRRP